MEELLFLLVLGLCCEGEELRRRRNNSGRLDDVKILVRDVLVVFLGDTRRLSDDVVLLACGLPIVDENGFGKSLVMRSF